MQEIKHILFSEKKGKLFLFIFENGSSQEELTAIKTVVMNTNKSKNFKPTQSADEVMDRIHILHG